MCTGWHICFVHPPYRRWWQDMMMTSLGSPISLTYWCWCFVLGFDSCTAYKLLFEPNTLIDHRNNFFNFEGGSQGGFRDTIFCICAELTYTHINLFDSKYLLTPPIISNSILKYSMYTLHIAQHHFQKPY